MRGDTRADSHDEEITSVNFCFRFTHWLSAEKQHKNLMFCFMDPSPLKKTSTILWTISFPKGGNSD